MSAVRPATARELDRVAALWTLLLAHHAALPSLAPAPRPEAALRAHLAALLASADAALLVAEADGDLAGFAALRALRRPALFAETERGEIEALYVRPEARRPASAARSPRRRCAGWRNAACRARRSRWRRATPRASASGAPSASPDAMDVLERPL